ncbi:hypothetical protein WMY93_024867 [Mugilogobius chulae]|uniref:F-BAR domain only protein 1-like n=1 Tax=Mugilogobius chulae TaxID=88201 RepID=A0AAW0N593_9GOBI
MKHGQLAAKELAEFVRERAAIEESYSKSMSKLAKTASNGSALGTFAPMWDVFRVSADKLALCHLELMRKMNDLIRDINKYGEEQVKVHRKTKEEMVGTVEAVQALQVQNGHLQKSKEGYHGKCLELERLKKEGAPQKEVEKAELKSKKAAESFALCIEKYNRAGGEFEQKMSESAQKFQEIEEAHLRQMKQLIKGYSHSIEDTHVQVGQVHEEFKQNVENIGIDNLIQKFAEQKGTGKDRPALVCFEDYVTSVAPEGVKKNRGKAFRLPGLGRRDKEPDSTDSAMTEAPNSPLEVDEEGFVIRADSAQNDILLPRLRPISQKFHIQIRPVTSGNRSSAAAQDRELKATVGRSPCPRTEEGATIRQPPVKKHQLSRNSSATGRSEDNDGATTRDGDQDGLRRSTSSPDHSRLSSAASVSDSLFGPPLESAFKSKSFDGREQLRDHNAFGASEYAAFSSDSSSPENVEDSGLDSPSHQTLGPSPEPGQGWAAWPPAPQSQKDQTRGRSADPFLSAFRDPSPARGPRFHSDGVWSAPSSRPTRVPPENDQTSMRFPNIPTPEMETSVWNCKHIPQEDPFLAFEQTVNQESFSDSWTRPPPRSTNQETRRDPFAAIDSKIHSSNPPSSSSSTSSHRKSKDRKRDRSLPPPVTPEDPFAITMIGSPTHQSALATGSGLIPPPTTKNNRLAADGCNAAQNLQPQKEAAHWNSVHNPFSDSVPAAVVLTGSKLHEKTAGGGHKEGGGERRKHRSSESDEPRRNAPPLTRHSGPQEDLCFSTDKDQDCLDITQPCSLGSHKGSKHKYRQEPSEGVTGPSARITRAKRTSGRLSGSERSRSLCSSPLPEPSPSLTSSSSSSPSEWGPQAREGDWGGSNRAPSPARTGQVSPLPYQHQDHTTQRQLHLSRGPSPISLSAQEAWPVAAAITEYINAYFKGGQSNRCLVKITGDLTMSFPAGITRIFSAHPNVPVLSFRLVNISRIDHFLPNQKLLFSDPSQSDPDTRDFWFNMQALQVHLQKEAELNPQASYYNVALIKYQALGLCVPVGSVWRPPEVPLPAWPLQFVGSGASLSGMDLELVGSRYRMSLVKKRFATGKYMAGCSM